MAEITQKENGSYSIRCFCGRDSNGKKLRKSMTWKPLDGMSKREIKAKLQEIVADFEKKCSTDSVFDSFMLFGDYVEKVWYPRMENNTSKTTFNRYKSIMKRIIPAFGKRKIGDIKVIDIYKFYDDLKETTRDDTKYHPKEYARDLAKSEKREVIVKEAGIGLGTVDALRAMKNVSEDTVNKFCDYFNVDVSEVFEADEKKLSQMTIKHHHRVLSNVLENAFMDEIIDVNPCKRVKAPRVEKTDARYLNHDEVEKMLEIVYEKVGYPYSTIIYFLLMTGLRRGECCGLEWSDVDFENNVISVNRSVLYLPNEGVYEGATKTYTSVRSFPVGQELMDELKDYKRWQDSEKKRLGSEWVETGKVFTAQNGDYMNPGTLSAWFYAFIRENNLPDVSLHSLRHTNASMMIFNGIPITTVAQRLGHATPATTTKVYAHSLALAEAAAASKLQVTIHLKRGSEIHTANQ